MPAGPLVHGANGYRHFPPRQCHNTRCCVAMNRAAAAAEGRLQVDPIDSVDRGWSWTGSGRVPST